MIDKRKKYNRTELARFYGVSYNTFKKWIRDYKNVIGSLVGRFYHPGQIRTIIKIFGFPTGKKYTLGYFKRKLKINDDIFYKWISPIKKKIGKIIGKIFTPKQALIIKNHLDC
jgi:hypothetical protein